MIDKYKPLTAEELKESLAFADRMYDLDKNTFVGITAVNRHGTDEEIHKYESMRNSVPALISDIRRLKATLDREQKLRQAAEKSRDVYKKYGDGRNERVLELEKQKGIEPPGALNARVIVLREALEQASEAVCGCSDIPFDEKKGYQLCQVCEIIRKALAGGE